jgi:hypothetical protein
MGLLRDGRRQLTVKGLFRENLRQGCKRAQAMDTIRNTLKTLKSIRIILIIGLAMTACSCATGRYAGSTFPVYFKITQADAMLYVIPDTAWKLYRSNLFPANENYGDPTSFPVAKERRSHYLIQDGIMEHADYVLYELVVIQKDGSASIGTYTPSLPGETKEVTTPLPTPFKPQ